MIDLTSLGFSEHFEQSFSALSPGLRPMRVSSQLPGRYRLLSADGEHLGVAVGPCCDAPPAVGDWVAAEPPVSGELWPIRHVLPRRTALVRQAAGAVTQAQVIAANMDVVLVVAALTAELNPARIHRYLTAVAASGARPCVVLNKADLCEDVESAIASVTALSGDVPIVAVSALLEEGLDALRHLLGMDGPATRDTRAPAVTAALVGSSGVGKSTLLNALAGRSQQAVRTVRRDDKGRHTTTRRDLFILDGAVLIDTPGMRELALWADGDAVPHGGDIIGELALACRFRDCTHNREPGCAVLDAVESGDLDPDLLHQVQKQQRELDRQEDRVEARRRQRARGKHIAKVVRRLRKEGHLR